MKGLNVKKISKVQDKLNVIVGELGSLIEGALEYYAERSENWQQSDTGDAFQAAIDELECAMSDAQSAADYLGNIEMGED
jgi:uncharacterized protein YaiE (UPF0345 family)